MGEAAEPVDTRNKFLVTSMRGQIGFMSPVPRIISEDDALLLAAYLVAMVADQGRWEKVLAAVENC